jgi:hypothetical protein
MLVDHYDHCALCREPLRGSKADTACSTSDNGYSPIKSAHSGFSFSFVQGRRTSAPSQTNGIGCAQMGLTISRQRLCTDAPSVSPGHAFLRVAADVEKDRDRWLHDKIGE